MNERLHDTISRAVAPEPLTSTGEVEQTSAESDFFVVGIGASAGGLESLERLFGAMPSKTGLAFVVVQHLSPDFKSLMDELLARYTDMPIHQAIDQMPVEPNRIYLIPARKEMIISHGRLLLTDKDPKHTLAMPIDQFFRSLAQDCGERAMGVILSGTGSDGSRGIRDIHDLGGLVVCESKQTAKFDGMPQAALDTGVVDHVLAPEAIPEVLVQQADRLRKQGGTNGKISADDAYRVLFKRLNEECGIDFSHYKANTVQRRIHRRLSIVGSQTVSEYVDRLQRDTEELNALYRDLLIGVTRFFRDQEAFARLEEVVVPELVGKAGDDDELRVWVAGCATGEEAYSVAMLIHEQLEKTGRRPKVKIFATDVHRASLDIAAAGVYSKEALAHVSPQRLARYFDVRRDGLHVVNELRQMIVFAVHNLINDAPFTKLDLITCRNLLIYLDPVAQRRSLSLFHFGLNAGGILFLGPSETPGELSDEFETLDLHWKMYRKCRDMRLPADLRQPLLSGPVARPVLGGGLAPARGLPDSSLVGAYDALLERYMPSSLLINERRELLHSFGGAEQYLRLKGGRPTSDVLELLDHDLRTAVTSAVQRALKANEPVSYSAVRIPAEEGSQQLRVSVQPLANPRSRLKQLLVMLEPLAPAAAAPAGAAADPSAQQLSRERIEGLEVELRHTKENLQTTIEELETSNEELQSTNEELVTSNEELQSTNEELQSVNEELFTVNAQYQRKITELSEMTSDMDNLLASTDIGTVFLDRDLCIRKFTPQVAAQFHLLPQDLGRSIDSFAHNMVHPGLVDDLRFVLENNERRELEVRDMQGKWHFLRILPYRIKARVEGVVLTLIEITPIKEAQASLAEAVRRRDEFLAMLSHELRNPLGAIINAVSILNRRELQTQRVQEVVEVLRRQAGQMGRLLDDLLDVSRVTQYKIEMRKAPAVIAEIVKGAVESVRPLIDDHGLEFSHEIDRPDTRVFGDAARLQQALSNVLANAAKYTPAGGRVRLEVVSEEHWVSLRVSDTGMGIPPEQLESIFGLFVQCDETLHRSKGGMGLGLTLVRSIVEQHGGSVTAASDGPGKGSRFEIRLPRLLESQADAVAAENDTAARPSSATILVVDDQEDNRSTLRTLLELDGYAVHTAENGPKALAAIEQHRPDVALIDIGMPGMDGYQLARQVRESLCNREICLVALTGYGQPQDVKAAQEAGFDVHFVKPVDPRRLAQLLEHRRKV